MEQGKRSFFRKLKTSIFDFDGYQDLAAEKIIRTILYIVLLMIIFSVVISFAYTCKMFQTVNQAEKFINNNISEIAFDNYTLTVTPSNNEGIIDVSTDNFVINRVIVNTKDLDENEINDAISEIRSEENGILILKDRIIIKTALSSNTMQYSLEDISKQYNINNLSKDEVINILNSNELKLFILTLFGIIAIYIFVVYFFSILVDILLFAVLAYIVSRLARLRLKYSAIYNIAAYSITLPVILNMLYIVANILTGFTMKYFQIMYTSIASIYIITAILMIKSDVIRKQMELNRIIEEQERVKQELKQKEEERKAKEELERREKRRKEKQKEEKEKKEKDENTGSEPEGNNA